MHDVSLEPLMLQLSENPQASLDIFRQSHHHPFGSCIYRKAINIDKPLVLWRTAIQAEVLWCVIYPRALPPVTQSSALQAPERMWGPIRGKEETSRGWGISVFVQLTQDFPGEQRNGGNNLPIGKTGKTFAASDLCTIFAPQKREDC